MNTYDKTVKDYVESFTVLSGTDDRAKPVVITDVTDFKYQPKRDGVQETSVVGNTRTQKIDNSRI